jgi:formylglycine-generating enzyme required for sulfatase activity
MLSQDPSQAAKAATRALTALVALSLTGLLRASDAADIDWVTVGDPENPADATGFGAVPYVFQIAKHEVSNEQYVEFLNAIAKSDPHGLWSESMGAPLLRDLGQGGIQENLPVFAERTGSPGAYRYACRPGWEKKPVVYVTFLSAMRFANWRHHGGGSGDTENGAYDLAMGGLAPREAGARVWIPSEDEWYKAAYYQPASKGGPAGGYWRYATRSNDQPKAVEPGSELVNAAIFGHMHQFRLLAPVGSVPNASSHYGTLDQAGNAWEWNEAILFGTKRGIRGGSVSHPYEYLQSIVRSNARPEREYPSTGFRLARRIPSTVAGGPP